MFETYMIKARIWGEGNPSKWQKAGIRVKLVKKTLHIEKSHL